jgi:hypothetical protein
MEKNTVHMKSRDIFASLKSLSINDNSILIAVIAGATEFIRVASLSRDRGGQGREGRNYQRLMPGLVQGDKYELVC